MSILTSLTSLFFGFTARVARNGLYQCPLNFAACSSGGSSAKAPIWCSGPGTGPSFTVRNFQHDFKQLCQKVAITGVRCSPHTFRHAFALNYLRRGLNLESLRRILGHSSILTTQKYLRSLGVEDLQAVHNGLSLLTR